jgi:hypothetical protein
MLAALLLLVPTAASFLGAERILHLRVVDAAFGPENKDREREVTLDLELRDVFRGPTDDARLHVVVHQSTITHYTSHPAGTWWVVEQNLSKGSELVAFCAGAGKAATLLPSSCRVLPAAPLLADLALLRDVDMHHADAIDAVRAHCATASHLATGYVWERHGAASARDLALFDRILALLVEPTCTPVARTTLLIDVTAPEDSLPHMRMLVRALFRLLAMPEARGEHDNLVDTYIPNWLGLTSGLPRRSADEIFAGAASARREAEAALRAYAGRADVKRLRKWIEK